MRLTLRDNLIFVTVRVTIRGQDVEIADVVLDTGSASTLLAADCLAAIGVAPSPEDVLYTVRGVGGTEVVFARKVECLQVGTKSMQHFEVEIGGMDYGFALKGILGMDFLLQTGAVIDLNTLTLNF